MAMTLDNYLSGGYAAQNAMAQRRAQDAATWKTMLTQINNTRPDTMLGYGLGKLLRGAWDHRQRRAFEEKAKQEEANRQHRNQVSSRAAANAGLAPVKGMLGDGFNLARQFQIDTGGNNPIAWASLKTKQEQQQPDGKTTTTTTTQEYPAFNLSDYPIGAAYQAPAQNQLNLTERAAQIAKEATNPNDIWKLFQYGRQG